MKRKFQIGALLLISCFIFMAGCSKGIAPKTEKILKNIKFQDIKAIYSLSGGIADDGIKHPIDFDTTNNIIKDLNEGKIQGESDELTVKRKGGDPYYVILELKDGVTFKIKAAVGGKVVANLRSEVDIPNEVTIYSSYDETPIRMLSPDLRKIIDKNR